MTTKRLARAVIPLGLVVALTSLPAFPEPASSDAQGNAPYTMSRSEHQAWASEILADIAGGIAPISEETRLRRSLAQATFCLPQNVLGILTYAFAQAVGSVLHVGEMNEVTVVVTRLPFGASLGRYLFIPDILLSERTVRHEYGHTMQGYRHGPFYLFLEGVTSFVQVTAATIFPSLAEGYFDHWPEKEADELGGVR